MSVVPLHPGEYSVLRHAAVLTSDSAERTTLSAVRILLGSLWRHHRRRGYAAAGRHARQRQPAAGIPLYRGDFGVLAAFFLLVSFRNVEEKITLTGERMTLKRASISLRANRPWWVFASNIFLMWGAFFFQTGAPCTSSIITSGIPS